MKRNFKLIKINAFTGESIVLEQNLREEVAFGKSYDRELVESKKTVRHYWYAVTARKDWQSLALEFLRYRRNLVLP
jgi:hypothetical protein